MPCSSELLIQLHLDELCAVFQRRLRGLPRIAHRLNVGLRKRLRMMWAINISKWIRIQDWICDQATS